MNRRDPDLGGIALAMGWRNPHQSRLDDQSEWMRHLTWRAGRRLREADAALALETVRGAS